MNDQSKTPPSEDLSENRDSENAGAEELAPPPLSLVGKNPSNPGNGPKGESESASESEALETEERLRELQESRGRLEEFSAHALDLTCVGGRFFTFEPTGIDHAQNTSAVPRQIQKTHR